MFGSSFTFSSGVWKSVYVAAVAPASAAITAVVPLTRYLGAYPVAALFGGNALPAVPWLAQVGAA